MTATPFSSVLVANRGEIALRIMRSVRAAGMQCIGVFTDADADAPHVRFADQAVNIGGGPVADSYLSIEKILDAARQTGAQAVHPGYGFLSEHAGFATACDAAGLVFIGPSAQAIDMMGNKAVARQRMIAAGVPCVPGYEGGDQTDETLAEMAAQIGFPVMIKAAAGGGGRGMRLVTEPEGFVGDLHLARAEAEAAFGSDQIILEKAILRPRHVEIQMIADRQGKTLHLGERDCSVQRRHQKVVEEAPCPVMTPELRDQMGQAAVQAAKAADYEGAGTVEFLLDQNGGFYFLEMNTRLQVEHPVTEMVTGLDLVTLQLSIASGRPLDFTQDDVAIRGHAIEVRLYAEDPARDFLPSTGKLDVWAPTEGDRVRVDSGVLSGQTISPFYDPMLAKVIAHGATRDEARKRLVAALQNTVVFGVVTNRDFLIEVLQKQVFAEGQATTAFISEEFGDKLSAGISTEDTALAAVLIYRALQAESAKIAAHVPKQLLGWGSQGGLTSSITMTGDDNTHTLRVTETRDGSLSLEIGVEQFEVSGCDQDMRINGRRADVRQSLFANGKIHVATGSKTFSLHFGHDRSKSVKSGGGLVTAPMHGNLLSLHVREGDEVTAGTRIAVLEAMKMQHEVLAEANGIIRAVPVVANTQVRAGEVLVEIEVSEQSG